jgi:hypothetical protein
MREDPRSPVVRLTARELDLYGNQLARCLKALGTDAPIRAEPPPPPRSPDLSALTPNSPPHWRNGSRSGTPAPGP